jgi:DNA-binding response OmpR family regulator
MAKNILVVDDEPNLVELLKQILEKEGYTVFTAHKGDEALAVLRKERVDLVLLDMMMPGMSGKEVAEKIRRNPKAKGVRIIFVTVARFSETGKKVLESLDVADYVTKPFENEDLIWRVQKVLGE